MRRHSLLACAATGAMALGMAAGHARAEAPEGAAPTSVREVQVTATRTPQALDQTPLSVSVIGGDELRQRGVNDLRTALSLVSGVEAPSGGDAGPASAVPSFMGLHEFDAFLLVVDGVPWGGAFNPSIPTLDLTNVERIEVLKGSAPVTFGATAFVGVIQVIHYPAGRAAQQASLGGGSFGSWRGSISAALPQAGGWSQSLALSGGREGFADHRETVRTGRMLYRGQGGLLGGTFSLDVDATLLKSVPPSPVVRDGAALTTITPRDANYNPRDARIDTGQYRAVLGYRHDTPLGLWETTASLAWSHVRDIRGFVRHDLSDDGVTPNADTFNQTRNIIDDYLDTHLTHRVSDQLVLVAGADLLYGRGTQASRNGEYYVSLANPGSPPASTSRHVDETNLLNDRRVFAGEYVQMTWTPDPRLTITSGVRINETSERKLSTHLDGFDPTQDTEDLATRKVTRPSGMIGATFKAWSSGNDELVAYASWRDAFKPAAIDFGPDNTPALLKPETAHNAEAGLKGVLADGRFDWEASLFQLDFRNLVVVTTNPAGDRIVQNAGAERLRGAEAEGRWRVTPDLSVAATLAWHDARFTRYVAAVDGANLDVSGNHLTLSPEFLASAGLIWAPPEGLNASLVAHWSGASWLNVANTARTSGYAMVDASLGWRWSRYAVTLNGYNLGDVRKPLTQSEFGEASYYLSTPRKLFVDLTARF